MIEVNHHPDLKVLKDTGVFNWQVWSKAASEFPWYYSDKETCYILEGEVVVTTDQGEAAHFGKGDLVVFPEGLSCTWKILKNVKKHYKFG